MQFVSSARPAVGRRLLHSEYDPLCHAITVEEIVGVYREFLEEVEAVQTE